MREIILDDSLIEIEADFKILNQSIAFGINETEFKSITNLDIIHKNYLNYLGICWNKHYGVVISPTIIWNMVLSNLAFEVNEKPETYQKYFTESDEKQDIIVNQGGNLINPEMLIKALEGKIPSKMLEYIFPIFSTNTEMSNIANYTAFLDMVSPYYNYGMLLCGIPKIKILGTNQDWTSLMFILEKIRTIIPEFQEYLLTVANRVNLIINQTCNFSEIFSLDRCGSGSQVMVSGWITELFIVQPVVPYPENFVSCISKIDYVNYNEGGKEYRLYAGLFTSEFEEGYLVPAFNTQYFEKTS